MRCPASSSSAARRRAPTIAGRWIALAAYVTAVYGFLPFGPRVGVPLARTALGGWFLGPGIVLLTLAGGCAVLLLLVRRGAPPSTYALLAAVAAAYVLAFSWLRSQHLERTHLPEYGLAAVLAWRALVPVLPDGVAAYVGAALLAAAIGWCDELLQKIVPGRVYDLRDVAMNAVGAVLGTLVIVVVRTRGAATAADGVSAGWSARRSRREA